MNITNSDNNEFEQFWNDQLNEIAQMSSEDLKIHNLPIARIKKIMKDEAEIKDNKHMIGSETPIVLAKACELFIMELTLYAWKCAQEGRRKTLQRRDVISAVCKNDAYDFLIDLIPDQEKKKHGSSDERGEEKSNMLSPLTYDMMQQYYNMYSPCSMKNEAEFKARCEGGGISVGNNNHMPYVHEDINSINPLSNSHRINNNTNHVTNVNENVGTMEQQLHGMNNVNAVNTVNRNYINALCDNFNNKRNALYDVPNDNMLMSPENLRNALFLNMNQNNLSNGDSNMENNMSGTVSYNTNNANHRNNVNNMNNINNIDSIDNMNNMNNMNNMDNINSMNNINNMNLINEVPLNNYATNKESIPFTTGALNTLMNNSNPCNINNLHQNTNNNLQATVHNNSYINTHNLPIHKERHHLRNNYGPYQSQSNRLLANTHRNNINAQITTNVAMENGMDQQQQQQRQEMNHFKSYPSFHMETQTYNDFQSQQNNFVYPFQNIPRNVTNHLMKNNMYEVKTTTTSSPIASSNTKMNQNNELVNINNMNNSSSSKVVNNHSNVNYKRKEGGHALINHNNMLINAYGHVPNGLQNNVKSEMMNSITNDTTMEINKNFMSNHYKMNNLQTNGNHISVGQVKEKSLTIPMNMQMNMWNRSMNNAQAMGKIENHMENPMNICANNELGNQIMNHMNNQMNNHQLQGHLKNQYNNAQMNIQINNHRNNQINNQLNDSSLNNHVNVIVNDRKMNVINDNIIYDIINGSDINKNKNASINIINQNIDNTVVHRHMNNIISNVNATVQDNVNKVPVRSNVYMNSYNNAQNIPYTLQPYPPTENNYLCNYNSKQYKNKQMNDQVIDRM